jgi:hypothetical protein
MSSVTSVTAQIARRIGYFITVGDISSSCFDVSQSTVNYNSWDADALTAATVGGAAYGAITGATGQVLQDMGEMAKVNGQIYRKVRKVTQYPAGGINTPVWIIVPGGEYPMQGYGAGSYSGLAPAPVARLG